MSLFFDRTSNVPVYVVAMFLGGMGGGGKFGGGQPLSLCFCPVVLLSRCFLEGDSVFLVLWVSVFSELSLYLVFLSGGEDVEFIAPAYEILLCASAFSRWEFCPVGGGALGVEKTCCKSVRF